MLRILLTVSSCTHSDWIAETLEGFSFGNKAETVDSSCSFSGPMYKHRSLFTHFRHNYVTTTSISSPVNVLHFTLESAPTNSEKPGIPIVWTNFSKAAMCLCLSGSTLETFVALESASWHRRSSSKRSTRTSLTQRNRWRLSMTTLTSGMLGNKGWWDTLNFFLDFGKEPSFTFSSMVLSS